MYYSIMSQQREIFLQEYFLGPEIPHFEGKTSSMKGLNTNGLLAIERSQGISEKGVMFFSNIGLILRLLERVHDIKFRINTQNAIRGREDHTIRAGFRILISLRRIYRLKKVPLSMKIR